MDQNMLIYDLPREIGFCRQYFTGDSEITFYLVATKPGGPPETEKSVLQVFNHLHQSGKPIERVFVNLDLSQKNGEVQDADVNLHPYRSFPDAEITKSISDYFIGSKMVSAAWAFGVSCQPETAVRVCEDWYHWANFRELLRKLSQDAGKTEALIELLDDILSQQSVSYENWEIILKLVRLELTVADWFSMHSKIEDYLQELSAIFLSLLPDGGRMVEFFKKRIQDASVLYESTAGRADALLLQSIEQLQLQRNTLGVIEVGIESVDYMADRLRSKGISFIHFEPTGVEMVSMLDQAALLLNVSEDSQNRLGDLFSGKEIRTRIHVLMDEPATVKKAWSDEWAQAALNLCVWYENKLNGKQYLERGEECARKALQLANDNANAWWALGQVDLLRHSYEKAVESYDEAVKLSPLNGSYWRNRGMALDGLRQTKMARNSFYRSIYANPKDGANWGQLGFHFHNHDLLRASSYCLKKGSDLGDATASGNYRMASQWSSPTFGCPLPLFPPVVYLMNRLVLPMRHDKEFAEDVQLKLQVALFFITIVSGAVYGAILGAQAGGIWGGVVAFILGTLGAGISFVGIWLSFLMVSWLGDSQPITRWRLALQNLALVLGAVIVGFQVGAEFGNGVGWGGPLWERFRSQIFGILAAGLFSLLGSFLYIFIFNSVNPSTSSTAKKIETDPPKVDRETKKLHDNSALLSWIGVGVLFTAIHWWTVWSAALIFLGYFISVLLIASLYNSIRRARTRTEIELSISIQAPREKVFDALADYETFCKITNSRVRLIAPVEKPVTVGTRWAIRSGLFNLWESEHVITNYDRPNHFVRRMTGDGRGTVEYSLETDASGTKVTERLVSERALWPASTDTPAQAASYYLQQMKKYLETDMTEKN